MYSKIIHKTNGALYKKGANGRDHYRLWKID